MTLDAQHGTARWRRPGAALLRNGLLALLSVAAGLAACEAALRLFHPRYELAAEHVPAQDRANVYRYRHHPDTVANHRVIYNSLGGRQSRNFPPGSLDGAVNIAFFGDSQTENALMPAQYSYTEPLDFLLNVAAGRGERDPLAPSSFASKPRFNVLNFGIATYGPGRAYLRWRNLAVRGKLAHVFYMIVGNDLYDLRWALRSGVVRLDESGALRDGDPPRPPAWKRLVARSHLTYLAIDAWRRLAARDPTDARGESRTDTPHAVSDDRALGVFVALLRRWRGEVEANGGTFHVVLLPNPPTGWGVPTLGRVWLPKLRERVDFAVWDLLECFQKLVPGFDYRQWRFANDLHWNPAANMVAATCLYRHLEGALGLPAHTPEALANARHAYYQAFVDSPAWEGERYMPSAAWARPPARGDTSASEAIVSRYLALEVAPPMEREWLAAVRNARAAGAVATSDWNVYVNVERRLLVYVKSSCPTDWQPAGFFFLHVVPFTREKLSAQQARLGFVNLDDGPFSPLRRMGDECVFSVPLPDYPLATAKTGRYTVAGEGRDALYTPLWQVAFAVPLARSVWDVYAGAGRRASLATRTLNYVKEPCGQADTDARFYLHVYPLRSSNGPTGITDRGYANMDFAWGEVGVKTDGACRISVPLPDFPIAFVYTGQFREGVVSSKRLWSVRVDFAEAERLRRRAGDDDA